PDIRNLNESQKRAWLIATKKVLAAPRLTAAKAAKTQEQRGLDACVLQALALEPSRIDELYADTLRMGEVRGLLASGRGKIRRERFAADVEQVAKDVAA